MSVTNANGCWFDKTPAEWVPNRIRNVAQLSPGFSGKPPADSELCTVVPMELLSDNGSINLSHQETIDELQSGLTLFEQGDVLFAKITPCMENGKGAYVGRLPTRYAFGSTEFHVLRPSFRIDGKFLYYSTFNPVFRAYAAENMTGAAGQKRVSSRFLKDARLFLPPILEQKRIAVFLDASCTAIDAAAKVKKHQIDTIDMLRNATIFHAVTRGVSTSTKGLRPSNIAWFGDIPQNWYCQHLKRYADRIQTGTTPPTDTPEYYLDGAIPWFSPGCYNGNIELHEPKKMISEIAFKNGVLRMFPASTVFLIGIGATIGRVGLITQPASCNQQIIGIVTNHKMNSRYLAYQLKIYEGVIPGISYRYNLADF